MRAHSIFDVTGASLFIKGEEAGRIIRQSHRGAFVMIFFRWTVGVVIFQDVNIAAISPWAFVSLQPHLVIPTLAAPIGAWCPMSHSVSSNLCTLSFLSTIVLLGLLVHF